MNYTAANAAFPWWYYEQPQYIPWQPVYPLVFPVMTTQVTSAPQEPEPADENGGLSELAEAIREIVREEIEALKSDLASEVIEKIVKQTRLGIGVRK